MTDLNERIEKIINSPSYRLAESDIAFLTSPELRPIRVQLELLKPELIFEEHGIESTIVVFGGTQVIPEEEARDELERAEEAFAADSSDNEAARAVVRAQKKLEKSPYYEMAREFSRMVSAENQKDEKRENVIVTGGGPGIMEAANRGADDVGAVSIGLNITLPEEQHPNAYITPDLCFQFHYFAIRKMHFLLRARALVIFPGGFGTLDEMFCALTLRQVNRMQEIPIILFGREYWENVVDFQFLADQGVIRDEHLKLIDFAETPDEAWKIIQDFHA